MREYLFKTFVEFKANKFLVALILSLPGCIPLEHCFGQTDTAGAAFIHSFLKQEFSVDSIVYADKLLWVQKDLIPGKLLHHSLYGYVPGNTKGITVALTRKERYKIRKETRQLLDWEWPKGLFPGSRRILSDSLQTYSVARFRQYITQYASGLPLYLANDARNYSNAFAFIKPIFFRNNTLVLFYYLRLCGNDCGEETLLLFRYENGAYRKWLVLGGGAF